MIKFQIKKKTNNIWEHFIIDGKTFILSDCYCKTNGDFFRVVEMGGSQRNEFHFSEIEVYNIGGLAETFTSSLALMQRLKSLNYVGFIREGDVVTADLISTDPSNSVVIGTDGGLFVPNFNAQSNTIINDAGFALVGNDLTINAGWIWNINGIEYTNNFNALLNIPFASVGYNRIDLIVANNNNSFTRLEGVEDISNPTAPTQPIDTILISFINVSDGDISDPTAPIIGNAFVKKSDFQTVENTQSGTNVIVGLHLNGASYINFTNPSLESISGVVFLTPVDVENEPPYPGKPYIFRNLTGNPVTFKHNQSVLFYGKKIITKDGLDIVIPNNEMVRFDYATEGMKDVFRSWSAGGGGELSIQNQLGVEQFVATDELRFKNVSFNPATKTIEVNPLVSNVIFVSSAGNDSTGTIENKGKPFKTLDAAITAFFANPTIDYIEIISDSSFSISNPFHNSTTRIFDLRSEKKCTVTYTGGGPYNYTLQDVNIYMPKGSFIFTPSSSSYFSRSNVRIEAGTLTFNSNHTGNSSSNRGAEALTFISNVLNLNSVDSIDQHSGNTNPVVIKSNIINMRGGSVLVGDYVTLTLDFNILTHDGTFSINTTLTNSVNIEHGSISSVSPYVNATNIRYLNGKNCNIRYKNGATISSNLTIDAFNSSGVLSISGTVKYPNSDYLIRGINKPNSVVIENANITCKALFNDRCKGNVLIISSYFYVNSYFGATGSVAVDGSFLPNNLEFRGINFIIGTIDGFDLYVKNEVGMSNRPSVDITKGILYTNGKFDRSKIDIYENPLNQYYDTTQRRNVIVNEKEEIVNKVLSSELNYLIDGVIELLPTDTIIVPVGGLSLGGYGFDVSSIKATGNNSTIFTSPVGGCGNLFMTNVSVEASGTNSKVFNLTNAGAPTGGADAIELNVVNFDNCTSLGELTNFRQGLWDNIGVFGCKDGLTLSGTWSGGFRSDLVIVRNFGIASTVSTLFKKGSDLVFQSRFLTDINADFKVGGLLSNFNVSNFLSNKLYQIKGAILTRDKVIDSTDNYTDTLNVNSTVCDWFGNIGLPNAGQKSYTIAEYANDYSASYTDRTLVDKQYSDSVKQVTIPTSRTALTSDNGCLIKIKGNATYTIDQSTLPTGWNVIVRSFTGATGTFVASVGTTFDAPNGLILKPLKMCSIIKDSDDNKILINGETSLV